ncbi:MAG: ATP-binding cassette domain-containing protein [Bacteroidales bacterium]|nr:ATP-binding cassette domain-containing protein [Bacteroidales bacterium]
MINYCGVTIERDMHTLLSNIDFKVSEGEYVYLIGKVGAGKSSLLKTLYADLPIASGSAKIFDYDLANLKKRDIPYLRRQLGVIFQDFQLLTDRIVHDNLEFVLKATGWNSKDEREARIKEVLALVGLETKAWRMPNTLSGGEQQRVVIARALLNSPKLILADEPTGNLDPEAGRAIVSLLHEICKSQHTAVVMATHNMTFLHDFPARVLKVEGEKLIEVNNEVSQQETQSAPTHEHIDNNMSEAHCSQSDTEPEEQDCNEQSVQTPCE